MAEEFQLGSGNWWESSSSSSTTTTKNRLDSGISLSSFTTTTTPSTSTALTSMASNFSHWPTDIVDINNRYSSLDSESVSESFASQDVRRDILSDPNLQMMGLGLTQNQTLFKEGKAVLFQENLNTTTNGYQEASSQHQDHNWRKTIFSGNSEDSSVNKGLSLHHRSVYSSNLESDAYGRSPSNIMPEGVLVSDNHNNLSYRPPYNPSNYPEFLKSSPPNQQPPHSQLHFSSNTQFWNSTAASLNDVQSSFFPSLHTQLPNLTADKKPKLTAEVRDTIPKKTTSDTSSKRPRNETPSPMPAFKVRKEKMGDRITALQQLVSPFGKTDTASVLSEVFEYIKFLHEQVTMLSKPYMKSGDSMQHPQNFDIKSNDPKKDLRSRGLCLVPVSSTFPVTNETTIDFWTPNSYGGTFR